MASDKNDQEHDPSLGPKVTAVHVGGESLADRLVPHLKKIAFALVALAAILTAFFTYRWWSHSRAEKATDRLARALELGDRPVIPGDMNLPGMPEHFKTQAERANAALAELAKAGSVRDAAGLYEAHMLVQAGKLDEALARYRKLGGAGGVDGAVAREGVGVVLETQASAAQEPAQRQKLLEDALAAFRAVQPDDKGPRRDYALYHEARVLEEMGKPAEAIAQLKKALTVSPETPLRGAIEMRLSGLGASEGS
ncbi:MAG TPA: hypothetical protein VM734_06575 [Kofleriaceae bacterium]|nr:hypothetical protein [Kofleriaceae bacterium]